MSRGVLVAPSGLPCSPPPWSTLTAVDLSTGEIAWERPLGMVPELAEMPGADEFGSPHFGGAIVTAGGLVFYGNQAGAFGGAVTAESSTMDLVNCLFDGNRVEGISAYRQGGGAIANLHGTLTATNCTFANNEAIRNLANPRSGVGGGFYHGIWSTQSTITNGVFWGNSDGDGTDESAQIFIDSESSVPPVVIHTLIHDLEPRISRLRYAGMGICRYNFPNCFL